MNRIIAFVACMTLTGCAGWAQRLAAADPVDVQAEREASSVNQEEFAKERGEVLQLRAALDPAIEAQAANAKVAADTEAANAKVAANTDPKCKPNSGMKFIPAGTFTMGDAENTDKAGTVTVAAFCMDTTEVTTAAYTVCVKSGKCTAAAVDDPNNFGIVGREQHPINGVDWNQATAYCAAQDQRLPTEQEWEYAARGTDGRIYPWGNAEPAGQLCWNGVGNSLGKGNRQSTCAVASFPAGNSPFGLADMSGNVWEWTSSAYIGAGRVNRGGCWIHDNPSLVRSASRNRYNPSSRYEYLGFRCAGSFYP